MVWVILALTAAAGLLGPPTRELLWVCCAAAALVLLAPAPIRKGLRYVAMLYHEAGHALAALITGGKAYALVVHRRGGAMMTHSGGWRPAVCMAGYLLPMCFGALLVCWGRMPIDTSRMAILAVGHLLLLLLARGMLTVLLCLGGAALFALLTWKPLPELLSRLVLIVFGKGLILEGLLAIKTLIRMSFSAPGRQGTDADLLARQARTLRHPGIWALGIAFAAVVLVTAVGVLFALHHPT